MRGARRFARPALIVAGAICLLVGGLTLYVDRYIFDSDAFADRASASLSNPQVRTAVAGRVTEVVVKVAPDAIAYTPIITGVVDDVIGTGAFRAILREAAYDVHRTVFKKSTSTATLTLADVGLLVTDALQKLNPELAANIPDDLEANLLKVSTQGAAVVPLDLARVASNVRWVAVVGLVVGAGLLGLAIGFAPRGQHRRTLGLCGIALAGVGIAAFLLLELILLVLVPLFLPAEAVPAARGVLDSFLGDLRLWSLTAAASGAILAGAASALIRPLDLSDTFDRIRTVVTATPATRGRRALRAALLIAVGIAAVVLRGAVLNMLALALGLAVLYVGVAEMLRLWLPSSPAGQTERLFSQRTVQVLRLVVTGGLMVVLIGLVVGASFLAARRPTPTSIATGCNGREELCGLRLDEVALPATHNSMSAASEGWLFANQARGIPQQLEDGIRGILIDTHYGFATPEGVATDLDNDPKSRAKIADQFGDEFVETAERLRTRIGYAGGGEREVFLCHGYCELGATPAGEALREIKEFLVRDPSAVLVISIEDGVSSADTAKEFEKSGLLDYVYRGPTTPLPTLGEMVDTGHRVLVMDESPDGSVPWLHAQYGGLVQETPYEFKSEADIEDPASCEPNRGGTTAPLMLMNNWIDTTPAPSPTRAQQVNAHDQLLARARACGEARHTPVNLLAVDFYDRGDVVGVAKELNGEAAGTAAPSG